MENTDCNLSQLLSKAAITEAPAAGDVQVNAPAKYQPDSDKLPTGSKLPSGMVQVDEFIDFPLLNSKTPEVLIPARSGAKTDQPNVKIGSSSNHAGFSFDRIQADSRRGFAFVLSSKGWETDDISRPRRFGIGRCSKRSSGSPLHRERDDFLEDREREKMQGNAIIKTFL